MNTRSSRMGESDTANIYDVTLSVQRFANHTSVDGDRIADFLQTLPPALRDGVYGDAVRSKLERGGSSEMAEPVDYGRSNVRSLLASELIRLTHLEPDFSPHAYDKLREALVAWGIDAAFRQTPRGDDVILFNPGAVESSAPLSEQQMAQSSAHPSLADAAIASALGRPERRALIETALGPFISQYRGQGHDPLNYEANQARHAQLAEITDNLMPAIGPAAASAISERLKDNDWINTGKHPIEGMNTSVLYPALIGQSLERLAQIRAIHEELGRSLNTLASVANRFELQMLTEEGADEQGAYHFRFHDTLAGEDTGITAIGHPDGGRVLVLEQGQRQPETAWTSEPEAIERQMIQHAMTWFDERIRSYESNQGELTLQSWSRAAGAGEPGLAAFDGRHLLPGLSFPGMDMERDHRVMLENIRKLGTAIAMAREGLISDEAVGELAWRDNIVPLYNVPDYGLSQLMLNDNMDKALRLEGGNLQTFLLSHPALAEVPMGDDLALSVTNDPYPQRAEAIYRRLSLAENPELSSLRSAEPIVERLANDPNEYVQRALANNPALLKTLGGGDVLESFARRDKALTYCVGRNPALHTLVGADTLIKELSEDQDLGKSFLSGVAKNPNLDRLPDADKIASDITLKAGSDAAGDLVSNPALARLVSGGRIAEAIADPRNGAMCNLEAVAGSPVLVDFVNAEQLAQNLVALGDAQVVRFLNENPVFSDLPNAERLLSTMVDSVPDYNKADFMASSAMLPHLVQQGLADPERLLRDPDTIAVLARNPRIFGVLSHDSIMEHMVHGAEMETRAALAGNPGLARSPEGPEFAWQLAKYEGTSSALAANPVLGRELDGVSLAMQLLSDEDSHALMMMHSNEALCTPRAVELLAQHLSAQGVDGSLKITARDHNGDWQPIVATVDLLTAREQMNTLKGACAYADAVHLQMNGNLKLSDDPLVNLERSESMHILSTLETSTFDQKSFQEPLSTLVDNLREAGVEPVIKPQNLERYLLKGDAFSLEISGAGDDSLQVDVDQAGAANWQRIEQGKPVRDTLNDPINTVHQFLDKVPGQLEQMVRSSAEYQALNGNSDRDRLMAAAVAMVRDGTFSRSSLKALNTSLPESERVGSLALSMATIPVVSPHSEGTTNITRLSYQAQEKVGVEREVEAVKEGSSVQAQKEVRKSQAFSPSLQ